MKKLREKMSIFFIKIKENFKKLRQMKHWRGVEITLMAVCSFVLLFFVLGIFPELFVNAEEKLPAQYVVATAEETTEEILGEEATEPETVPEEIVDNIKYQINKKINNIAVAKPNDPEDIDHGDDYGKNSSKLAPSKSPNLTNRFSGDAVNTSSLLSSSVGDFQYLSKGNLSGYKSINNTLYCFDENNNPSKGFKDINNVKYYFNENGAQASKVGIDVSNHNGDINWRKVKAAGVDFAIIRVGFRGYGSEGALKLDYKFEENMNGATAAGIDVGVYFYSQAITIEEALEEASAAVKYAQKYKVTYPIYFDTEFSTERRSGRADKLSATARTNMAVAFCEAVRNSGYKAGVYASKTFFTDELKFSRLSSYEIWVAHYTSQTTDFKYNYRVWQYTDKGRVDGIPNNTDINISLYDYKTGSNMSNVGSNLILLNSDDEVAQVKTCEKSIELYEAAKTEQTYNDTLAQIYSLANNVAREKLAALLEKKKDEIGFIKPPDEATTEAKSESDTQEVGL